MVLTDGAFHAVDSSELAFRLATIGAFREVYRAARPVILEPFIPLKLFAPGDFPKYEFYPFKYFSFYLTFFLLFI